MRQPGPDYQPLEHCPMGHRIRRRGDKSAAATLNVHSLLIFPANFGPFCGFSIMGLQVISSV
jgi:hypothetical protein